MTNSEPKKGKMPHLQRYLLTGVLTVIPLWTTWVVFKFVITQLSNVGMPWVSALLKGFPTLAELLGATWIQTLLAALLTLLALYALGFIATQVIGRRMLKMVDRLMARIPIVQLIYGATSRLLTSLKNKPEKLQRVALINFPSEHMKTVGFVTRVMTDKETGRQLAAVYVPTTPNPTSGYLEIVPVEDLVSTDWTVDEAMAFVITAGAVAPDELSFGRPKGLPDKAN